MCCPSLPNILCFCTGCNKQHIYMKHVWWCCHDGNLFTVTTKRGNYIQSPSVSLGSSVIPVQLFTPLFLYPDSSWPSLCCVRLIFIFQNLYNYHLQCTVLIVLHVYIIMFIKIPQYCGVSHLCVLCSAIFPWMKQLTFVNWLAPGCWDTFYVSIYYTLRCSLRL
jgi:hypothetical protein